MRRGFTLIELLVVIAIIAILAAILFPVFAKARSKAQQNTCLSNVKELMLATMMYMSDYDQITPGYGNCSNGGAQNSAQPALCWLLFPYTKNYQIFQCPSTLSTLSLTTQVIPAGNQMDYVANATNLGNNGTAMEKFPYPAEWWLLADMGTANQNQCNSPACGPMSTGANNPRVGVCHNQGTNVGFMDGHAQWKNQGDPLWSGSAGNVPASDGTITSLTALIRHFWMGTD